MHRDVHVHVRRQFREILGGPVWRSVAEGKVHRLGCSQRGDGPREVRRTLFEQPLNARCLGSWYRGGSCLVGLKEGGKHALVQQPSDSSGRCCGHEAEWIWMIHDLLAHVRTHDEQALLEQPGIDGPPFDRHGLESLTTRQKVTGGSPFDVITEVFLSMRFVAR